MNNQIICYRRVSTQEQGKSGLSLRAQITTINRFAKDNDLEVIGDYQDICSGKTLPKNRDSLPQAIELARKTGAKIAVTRLDRLSRSVQIVSELMSNQIPFVVVDMPDASPFMLHIYSAVAELERQNISDRIKVALAQKKEELAKEGRKLGNPNLKKVRKKAHKARKQQGDETAKQYIQPIQAGAMFIQSQGKKPSLQRIADWLNTQDILTPKGGKWYPTSVKNIVDRAKELGLIDKL